MLEDPVLECQDCGRVLRRLSLAEAQQVATNPYNYVMFCNLCRERTEGNLNGY